MFDSQSFVAAMFPPASEPAMSHMPTSVTAPSAPEGESKGLSGAGSKVGVALRAVLASGQPGQWATDHRAETEHFTGWNYVLINLLAMQVAQADARAYHDPLERAVANRESRKRKRLAVTRGLAKAYQDDSESVPLPMLHPVTRLLAKPNPTQSGAMLQYERVVQLRTTGAALTWHVPSKAGKIAERYVVPTAMAEPVAPSADLPGGGWRIRQMTSWSQNGWSAALLGSLSRVVDKVIPAEQMQAIRLPHPLFKDDSLSPLAATSVQVDTAEQIDQSRWSHLRHGIDPSLWIKVPANVDVDDPELKRIQARLAADYGGARNHGKAFIGTGGAEATPLSTNPKDMGYHEGWIQGRDFLAALHSIPVSMLTADGYASLYAGLTQLTTMGVQPLLDILAEEDTRYLSTFYGEGLAIEYSAQPVNDAELVERQLQTDLAAGCRTVDEIRKLRGLEPWGGERGARIAGVSSRHSPSDEA